MLPFFKNFIPIIFFFLECSLVSGNFLSVAQNNPVSVESSRKAIQIFEDKLRLGNIRLTSPEVHVDQILQKIKFEEIEAGLNDSSNYLPAKHFFEAKPLIERSKVFKFIKKMPKGANLHGHNSAMVSSEWVIKNVTYRPGAIMYTNNKGVVKFTFKRPAEDEQWRYIADVRAASSDVHSFDMWLDSKINLQTPRPERDYPDHDSVWRSFEDMFTTIQDVIRYYPVFVDYHLQLLRELAEDNVMYTEIRTSFGELYDDYGKNYNKMEVTDIWWRIVEEYKKENPSFFGAKLIYSASRSRGLAGLSDGVDTYRLLNTMFPDFVIGFDIVGHEKADNANVKFINKLRELPPDTKYFFHAGETNWYGTPMDENLIDAILLNTTRIGHAYALSKHPYLWQQVKQKRIAVEISPISNQVLKLVHDMRNHPGAFFISENLPIVICNDDPGFWGAKGLSYDFYYAFMAMAPSHSGLETLKKFAWASLEHSILTDKEWIAIQDLFNKQWNKFIHDVLQEPITSN